ncbi:MAG: DUF3822 family protein [Bacteroidales bacterium]|jgi:hypothetical protein|nr:DUF3822 family protein [Bacteroidales bacterium]
MAIGNNQMDCTVVKPILTTIVPDKIYNENMKEQIVVELMSFATDAHKIIVENCQILKSKLLSVYPKDISDNFCSEFNVEIPRFFDLLKQYKKKNALYLHIEKDYFNAFAVIKNQFVFANTFDYPSVEKLMYYLLLVAQSTAADVKKISVFLTGDYFNLQPEIQKVFPNTICE